MSNNNNNLPPTSKSSSPFVSIDEPEIDANDEFEESGATVVDEEAIERVMASVAKNDAVGIQEIACPSCGVNVPNGYVVCPKCKTSLSINRRKSTEGSGTTVAKRTVPLSIILLAAIGTAVIWYLAERDDPVQDGPASIEMEAITTPESR